MDPTASSHKTLGIFHEVFVLKPFFVLLKGKEIMIEKEREIGAGVGGGISSIHWFLLQTPTRVRDGPGRRQEPGTQSGSRVSMCAAGPQPSELLSAVSEGVGS